MDWEPLRRAALQALEDVDDPAAVVLYLDRRRLDQGDPVDIDRQRRAMPFAGAVAFLDLEPQANWGHRCRYLLVPEQGGPAITVDARMPPFLARVPDTLEVLHQGADAPDWTVRRSR